MAPDNQENQKNQENWDSWQAHGTGEHGRLILQFNSGDSREYQLRRDYANSRLYVDDKRWLHIADSIGWFDKKTSER